MRRGAGYRDRDHAGRELARALEATGEGPPDAVVVGLARGGVPVAAEVARTLGAELDVVVVRKVGHPLQPELALAAVTAGGRVALPPRSTGSPPPDRAAIDAAILEARAIEAHLRSGRPPAAVEGRACILVDDGLATGASMRAAVRWARSQDAARVVVAVPVASRSAAQALRGEADAVVCPLERVALGSVGEWYGDFSQVGDAQVVEALTAAGEDATSV